VGVIPAAAAFSLAVVTMLVGLVGVILPVLPGLVLIWLAALGYGLVEGFANMTLWTFAGITLMTAAGVSADIWLTQLGARLGGAKLKSQLAGLAGGAAGALVFLFFGGITAGLGAILGSIAGVLGAEYLRARNWEDALRAGGGWLLGWLASTVLQLILGVLIIALFVWQVLAR